MYHVSDLPSYFSFYPSHHCHVLACQFESQWQKQEINIIENQPFTQSIELALQYIGLWHLAKDTLLYLHGNWNEPFFQSWFQRTGLLERKDGGWTREIPNNRPVEFWGTSPSIIDWIKTKKGQCAPHPDLAVIQAIHDKRFIENWRGRLVSDLGGGWLTSWQEIEELQQADSNQLWMVKRAWSAAGRGNAILNIQKPSCKKLVENWLQYDGGCIVQPFVDRLMDFSSLWWIDRQGHLELFGMTRMQTSPSGRYQGCYIGKKELLFGNYQRWIDEHLEQACQILSQCVQMGYWGPIGLDAMVYTSTNSQPLTAIIEINARQTLAMHLVSVARSLFPSHAYQGLVQAKLLPASQKAPLNQQLLLPEVPGSFQIALQPLGAPK